MPFKTNSLSKIRPSTFSFFFSLTFSLSPRFDRTESFPPVPSSSSSSFYKCSPLADATPHLFSHSLSPNSTHSFLFSCLRQFNFMADLETVRKRPRDQAAEEEVLLPPAAKRPYSSSSSSYDTILDFLESVDENLPEDVSSLISSLQEELSETLPSPAVAGLAGEGGRVELSYSDSAGEEVIRRLVEASDDELGIPAGEAEVEEEEEEEVGREVGEISNYDVFWELEEEAANHYMLQSELFMA